MPESKKILIVDDDPDYVETTRTILERKSYLVEAVHNREDALAKIPQMKPDLIILDIMMQRLNDGFKICYDLKHDEALKDIPVLAISSVNQLTGLTFSPETDGEYFQADAFAEKPVQARELLRLVHELLTEKGKTS